MSISRQKLFLPGAVLAAACVFALLLLVTAPKVESLSPERQQLTVRVMHAKPASMRFVFVRNNAFVGSVTARKGWSAFNRVGPAAEDFEDHQVLDRFCREAELLPYSRV